MRRTDSADSSGGRQGPPEAARTRLDKWLWAARFYKTRSLAAKAIEAGQVKLNAVRIKTSHAVRIGDTIAVRKDGLEWEAVVTALADRRGDAKAAGLLFRETEASAKAREEAIGLRKDNAASGLDFAPQ